MNFRQLRERAGITQYRLAQVTGVEQTTISQLELGKVRDPRWSTISALAEALDTTPGVVAKAITATAARKKIRMTDEDVVEAMTRYGGSFVQALAECWRRADAVNRAILKTAFAASWTQYAELVERRDRRERGTV